MRKSEQAINDAYMGNPKRNRDCGGLKEIKPKVCKESIKDFLKKHYFKKWSIQLKVEMLD